MNETTVTVVGTVCSDIRYTHNGDTTPSARFQIRNTPRRYDKRTESWGDGDPSYYTAVCWRTLADHVASSMGVGDPVVATGRLRINRWRRGEELMVTAELDVQAIGHDLRWGTTVYRRSSPPTRIPGPGRPKAEGTAAAVEASTGVAGGASGGGEGAPGPIPIPIPGPTPGPVPTAVPGTVPAPVPVLVPAAAAGNAKVLSLTARPGPDPKTAITMANGTTTGTADRTPNGTADRTPNGTADRTPNGTAYRTPNGMATGTAIRTTRTPSGTPTGAPNGTPTGTANGAPTGLSTATTTETEVLDLPLAA